MTTTETSRPESSTADIDPTAQTPAPTTSEETGPADTQQPAPQPNRADPLDAPPVYRPTPRTSNLSGAASAAPAASVHPAPEAAVSFRPAPDSTDSAPPAPSPPAANRISTEGEITQVMRIPIPHTMVARPVESAPQPTLYASLESEDNRNDPPPSVSTTIWAALRERWPVAVAACLLTTLLAVLAGAMMPAEYEASATVQVEAMSSSAKSVPLPEVNTASEATTARSTEIAEAVADTVKNGKNAQQLVENLQVVAPANEQTLRFTYTSTNAQDAATVANAFAQAYLDARTTAIRQSVDQMRTELQDQLTAVTGTGPAADQQRNLIREQMGQLPYGLYVGRITDKASTPTNDSSQPLAIFAVGGLVAGAILGLLAAIGVDRIDPHIRNRRRLAQLFAGPIVDAAPEHNDETANQTVLFLRAAAGTGLTREIAVLCPAEPCGDRPVEALRNQLAHEATTASGLSHGAPIYWFDARSVPSLAGRLEAATTSDAAILVVNRKDRRRALTKLLAALGDLGSAITVCVLVDARERP